jgi:hypothetical protein
VSTKLLVKKCRAVDEFHSNDNVTGDSTVQRLKMLSSTVPAEQKSRRNTNGHFAAHGAHGTYKKE